MPTRKFHNKSRHGCHTCKKSKVRCDFQKPVCGRCIRLERPCSYAGQGAASDGGSVVGDGVPKTKRSFEPGRATDILENRDLALMHHYSTKTYITIAGNEAQALIWQYDVPELCFADGSDFLLHGILALAAQHRRYDCSATESQNLANLAHSHQQAALTAYIPLLQTIDERNCYAMFAFSVMLNALSLSFMQYPEEDDTPEDLIEAFIKLFDMLFGATAIAYRGHMWLRQSKFAAYLGAPPFENPDIDNIRKDAQEALKRVVESAPQSRPLKDLSGQDSRSALDTAATMLTALFVIKKDPNLDKGKIFGWPVYSGGQYLALLKDHEPRALVILAYFGVVLHYHSDRWFIRDLGKRLVEAVYEMVDESMRQHLRWPAEELAR